MPPTCRHDRRLPRLRFRSRNAALGRVRQGQLSRARQDLTDVVLAPRLLRLLHCYKSNGHNRGSGRFSPISHGIHSRSTSGIGFQVVHRVYFDDREVFHLFLRADEDCASACQPGQSGQPSYPQQKADGGVRGSATGTSFQRLVAKTLAHKFGKAVEATCASFQFALSTRAGADGLHVHSAVRRWCWCLRPCVSKRHVGEAAATPKFARGAFVCSNNVRQPHELRLGR